MFLTFVTTRALNCNDRLIDGLFHSRCLDFHANEKIIMKLALPEKTTTKAKQTSFKDKL